LVGFPLCGLQYPAGYCVAKLWWKSGTIFYIQPFASGIPLDL
jgi:hypothetical protein